MERIRYGDLPKGMYEVMAGVENYLHQSGIDLHLVELLKYRISQLNHCAYCLDMHYKEALNMGEEPLRLYSVSAWRECPYYSEKEQVALELAEALTDLPRHHIEETLFEKLKQFFNVQEIALLTLARAQINSWNRLQQVMRSRPGEYKVKV